jgi:predicted tellurium resistance membrane protein TerC
VSGRDLVLVLGGLFLVAKATFEIHDDLEGHKKEPAKLAGTASFAMVLTQIMLLDLVFSLDSVITAVGMVDRIGIMVSAIVAAVLVMMLFAKTVGDFVGRHPTIRMLALSFLLMIGVMLVVEGTGNHVPKGYIYFAMAFSLFVELLNMKAGSRDVKPVQLR